MTIQQEKKAELKQKLIDTAVRLMSDDGFKGVSMRKIAKAAEVGDATIYNYFPNKESILYAYFQQTLEQSISVVNEIPELEQFTLHEKLQELLEQNLRLLLNNREFAREAFELAFLAPLSKFGDIAQTKATLGLTFSVYLEQEYESGRLEQQPFSEMLPALFWDYYISVVVYWLKDDSKDFIKTTQLIDLSLSLAISVLESGVIGKCKDLVSFLLRHHMFNGLEYLDKAMSSYRTIKNL